MNAGRLTLNPIPHLDPIGTAMLAISYYFLGFPFGWAKPVPVNPYYFRDPRKAMIWVSFAGPASNLALAAFLGLLLRLIGSSGIGISGFLGKVLFFAIFINVILAFFNLIPIPPLDGSKIVGGLLPHRLAVRWYELEKYGFLVLIGVLLISNYMHLRIFSRLLLPIVKTFVMLFTGYWNG